MMKGFFCFGYVRKQFYLVLLFFCASLISVRAQYAYGTTGLLRMPTAEMNTDKTFMAGFSYLNKKATQPRKKTYDTFNYYFGITLFPWLEISYTLVLNQGTPGKYWPENTWGKFVNQDRSFHGKIRLWQEGWLKPWVPQVVIGANDPLTHKNWGGGQISTGGGKHTHNYLSRYFITATKHFSFMGLGNLGVHAAYITTPRNTGGENYSGPALGINFKGQCTQNKKELFSGEEFGWDQIINGLNVMAEYDARSFNVGGSFSMWHDRVNLIAELNHCKYFSAGVFFKVHLK